MKSINAMCSLDDNRELRNSHDFKELLRFSDDFVVATRDITAKYRWNPDPLKGWSRSFEYPWVYRQIQMKKAPLKIADFGGGVTFFPFFLCSKGYQVDVYDIDDYTQTYIDISGRLKDKITQKPRFFHRSISDLKTTDKYDIIYCVSVIEHVDIYMFPDIVAEVKSHLSDNGVFIFTLDIDGSKGMRSINNVKLLFRLLEHELSAGFDFEKLYFDGKKNITPAYIDRNYGCSDTFSLSPKKIFWFLARGKKPKKYPDLNICYGYVCK
ncbi:MAG: class I SAM-dependent methyltransferase [Candidatus Auribacterota bacterium]|jgi:2-polyprenyl-3-methyl-5-hydroxy-6-metoxy-1,4-benzoquinol methylase|nr:class I SAM-dependent methyltransferase [Candidatus Auribacterota bacterium]